MGCYDRIILKTAEGTASIRGKVAEVITERLTVTNITVVVTQEDDQVESLVLNTPPSRSFGTTISLANLTQKAFEETIAALDRQVQDDRNQSQTELGDDEWQVKFTEALAQLQPGFTPADLSFPYMSFYHEGWTADKAAQALIETHVLRPA